MPAETIGRSQPTLSRAVSRWQVVALSVNDVIGSGVYLLPAAAALLLGPGQPLGDPGGRPLRAAPRALLRRGRQPVRQPGGGYVYTREAFGEFVGFEVGWMTWVARVTVGRQPVGRLRPGDDRRLARGAGGLGRARSRSSCRSSLLTADQRGRRQARRADRRWSWSVGKVCRCCSWSRRPVRDRLGTDLPPSPMPERRNLGRPRFCSSSPTPASRTPPRRPASTSTRSATCRSPCWS